MALTGKVSTEVPIKSSASEFYGVFASKLHHVQNVCEKVHGTKLHEGEDWHGTDSVKHWTYVIDGKVTTCKEKIDSYDEENKTITYNLFDGDVSQHYKVFKLILQAIDKNDGCAAIKWTIEYEKINEDVEGPYGYIPYFDKCTKEIDDHIVKDKNNKN